MGLRAPMLDGPSTSGRDTEAAGDLDAQARKASRNKDDPCLTRLLYRLVSWFDKVPLEKGYSQVDWLRLSRQNPNLNGLNGKPPLKGITMEEVRKHNSADDCWMVLRGKVYNVTPYMRFHPGGTDILVRAAGKDATTVFMKYHPWVNVDALMEKCLVGWLEVDPIQAAAAAEVEAAKRLRQQLGARSAEQEQQQQQQQQLQQAIEGAAGAGPASASL